MRLLKHGLLKFDNFLPIYNWYYPLSGRPVKEINKANPHLIFERLNHPKVRSRAFYFHIPFCKTICTFCPFARSILPDEQTLEKYVRALIREMKIKAKYDAVSRVPVGAIFFGGGTPSILTPHQIRRIGVALRDGFDLSQLGEFSVEMTVATITPEKIEAFRDIGVTHARFGIQTFDARYRDFFNLKSKLEDIYNAAETLSKHFPHTSFDMLYGMNGQTDGQFISDIHKAVAVGIPNIDFYPINNVVTQPVLRKAFEKADLPPTSGLQKFLMNILLRESMAANGYLPHNGHGYVKVSSKEIKKRPVVTNEYTFRYHKYVYGDDSAEIIGFGTNAISSLNKYTIQNEESWESYIQDLTNDDSWGFFIIEHDQKLDAGKGIVLHLPYHGYVDKDLIEWRDVHPETLNALKDLINADLVVERPDRFELTLQGWYWYVNLLYYLSPRVEQRVIDRFVAERRAARDRQIEMREISFLEELDRMH